MSQALQIFHPSIQFSSCTKSNLIQLCSRNWLSSRLKEASKRVRRGNLMSKYKKARKLIV
jgi:hypothetical protein